MKRGGGEFKGFYKVGANLRKILIFETKIRGVNSVPGEKLHDFEIICPARGAFAPQHPLRTGLSTKSHLIRSIIWDWVFMNQT